MMIGFRQASWTETACGPLFFLMAGSKQIKAGNQHQRADGAEYERDQSAQQIVALQGLEEWRTCHAGKQGEGDIFPAAKAARSPLLFQLLYRFLFKGICRKFCVQRSVGRLTD